MKYQHTATYRLVAIGLSLVLSFPLPVPAQGVSILPPPGTKVELTAAYNPAMIRGITIYPDNHLQFDFIIDAGDDNLEGDEFKQESTRLIKYFLASLTIPEDEMWVNLSPYERDRIVPDAFGQTEMGRDLLAQDYMLKQLTASLMHPEEALGAEFWKKIYAKAQEHYGTMEIPTKIFNKVWIVPEKAVVYVNGPHVFVSESRLKVMLEEDYLALEANQGRSNHGLGHIKKEDLRDVTEISAKVIREVIIPVVEKEVNEGKIFANLRQIYTASILASWYKQNLRQGILGQKYIDKNKIVGLSIEDKNAKMKIYDRYVEAFRRGVYNFIKEDYDVVNAEFVPRKYFSGGAAIGVKDVSMESDQETALRLRTLISSPAVKVVSSAVKRVHEPTYYESLYAEALNAETLEAKREMLSMGTILRKKGDPGKIFKIIGESTSYDPYVINFSLGKLTLDKYGKIEETPLSRYFSVSKLYDEYEIVDIKWKDLLEGGTTVLELTGGSNVPENPFMKESKISVEAIVQRYNEKLKQLFMDESASYYMESASYHMKEAQVLDQSFHSSGDMLIIFILQLFDEMESIKNLTGEWPMPAFLFTGSELLFEAAKSIQQYYPQYAEIPLKSLYFTTKMAEGYLDSELLEYFNAEGILNNQHIFMIDTAFKGSLARHLYFDIIHSRNLRDQRNEIIDEDNLPFVWARMFLYATEPKIYAPGWHISGYNFFAGNRYDELEEFVRYLDQGIPHSYKSPTKIINNRPILKKTGALFADFAKIYTQWYVAYRLSGVLPNKSPGLPVENERLNQALSQINHFVSGFRIRHDVISHDRVSVEIMTRDYDPQKKHDLRITRRGIVSVRKYFLLIAMLNNCLPDISDELGNPASYQLQEEIGEKKFMKIVHQFIAGLEDNVGLAAAAPANNSAPAKGGIDLNSNIEKIQALGKGADFRGSVELAHSLNIVVEGLSPVIVNIAPITNINILLGLEAGTY